MAKRQGRPGADRQFTPHLTVAGRWRGGPEPAACETAGGGRKTGCTVRSGRPSDESDGQRRWRGGGESGGAERFGCSHRCGEPGGAA